MKKLRYVFVLIICFFMQSLPLNAFETSGWVNMDHWHFYQAGIDDRQKQNYFSGALQIEFFAELPDSGQQIVFTPFQRVDAIDEERTHFDLREAYWLSEYDFFELSVGLKKVFWGVSESRHLVDIINQTNFVENPDGTEKLGQPMIHLLIPFENNTLELFVLTGFRERTFPGPKSRFRLPFDLDSENSAYESDQKQKHIDGAIRYAFSFDALELGLSYFEGTGRDPQFIMKNEKSSIFVPYYRLIKQWGLDVQWNADALIWKLEVIQRRNKDEGYIAATTGFEYSVSGILDSNADLTMLAEHLYDDRLENADTPFENDLFIAARVALNDEQNLEFTLGLIKDIEKTSQIWQLQMSRRLGDSWKLDINSVFYQNIDPEDVLADMENNSYLSTELTWYF